MPEYIVLFIKNHIVWKNGGLLFHSDQPTRRPTLSQKDSDPEQQAVPESTPSLSPLLRQCALQFAAFFTTLSIAWPYFAFRDLPLSWFETSLVIGALALLVSVVTSQPWWWRLIHACFAPLIYAVSLLAIDPGWFLLALILLLLFFRGAVFGQVPLFLSNRDVVQAVAEITAGNHPIRFIDLGAGIGSIVRPLCARFPESSFTGVENSPAVWLLGFFRVRSTPNCTWRWSSLWNEDLGRYDVVYAFLSPAPMRALWEKAAKEMRPGSLFISNSFPVPGIEACAIVEAGDKRNTRLYCYRLQNEG